MTKQELLQLNDRLCRELDYCNRGKYAIKKAIEESAALFKNNLAEESYYNDGVKATLNWITGLMNKYLNLGIEPIRPKGKIIEFKPRQEIKE